MRIYTLPERGMFGTLAYVCGLLLFWAVSVASFVPRTSPSTSAFRSNGRQQYTPSRIHYLALQATRFRVRERIRGKINSLTKGIKKINDDVGFVDNSNATPHFTRTENAATSEFFDTAIEPEISLNGEANPSIGTFKDAAKNEDSDVSFEGQKLDAVLASTAVLEKPAQEAISPNIKRATNEEESPTLADKVETVKSTESILTPDLPLPEVESMRIKRLYSLPPVDRDLSKLETEFREMLLFFSNFTEADLYSIRDPRVRTIFEGVIASSKEPAVYRAFEVLFEDMVPLRIAGRMIYTKLKQVMEAAQSRGQTEVDEIVATTGLPSERVEVSRLAFLTLAVATEHAHDDEAHLSIEQLVDSGLAETAMQLLGYDDVNHFIKNVDNNQDEKVTFSELMVGLQMMAEETCAIEKCDPAVVLQAVVNQVGPSLSNGEVKLDSKRQEYSIKFDKMVGAFQDWQDVIPSGEGRRLDVLRGCFVGAANKRVVEALRVVYLDYSALRVAGNTIFSLMSALVAQLRKRQQKN